jgi:hypothetical protein
LESDFKENAMCDYALEMYGTHPAREGEKYVTTRFPSGMIGLASPGNTSTPVCVACDTQLLVEKLLTRLQEKFGVSADTPAVFTRQNSGAYRDGLALPNGRDVCLQDFEPDIEVSVVALVGSEATPIKVDAAI